MASPLSPEHYPSRWFTVKSHTSDKITVTVNPEKEKITGMSADWVIFDEVADMKPGDIWYDEEKEEFRVATAKFSSKVVDLLKSNTSTIESAVIGEGRLKDMEEFVEVMEELLVPIMKHDRFWSTTGPVKLSAFDEKKNKWKMISCLGGEKLEYKGMRVGNRDGLLFQWFSTDIPGVSDELVIETSVPKHGHMLAAYDDERNEVTTKILRTELAEKVGKYDLLEKIEEIHAEAEKIKKAEKAKRIEEQAEHYGGGFGSWG